MDNGIWKSDTIGAYCFGENGEANVAQDGLLYNYYAVDSARLCPKGWHLPSAEEWEALNVFAGGAGVAGKKLKSKEGWADAGNGTNDFGFRAYPVGVREATGYKQLGKFIYFWSSTPLAKGVRTYHLAYNHNDLKTWSFASGFSNGYSVRCIKD